MSMTFFIFLLLTSQNAPDEYIFCVKVNQKTNPKKQRFTSTCKKSDLEAILSDGQYNLKSCLGSQQIQKLRNTV